MISRKIGKYGVGLVTSSLSQGERIDVWSWQKGIESAWHCRLDVDEVRRGLLGVPEPDQEPLPPLCVQHARETGHYFPQRHFGSVVSSGSGGLAH